MLLLELEKVHLSLVLVSWLMVLEKVHLSLGMLIEGFVSVLVEVLVILGPLMLPHTKILFG